MAPPLRLMSLALPLSLAACASSSPAADSSTETPPAEASPAAASGPASGPASRPAAGEPPEVAARVAAARARLEASEAGRLVLRATEAHGGLEAWFGGRALRFRYDYRPVEGVRRNSLQTIDLLGSRAYHDMDHPAEGRIGYADGEAWRKLAGDAEYPAKFWALTPYYFVGMPFVLSDAGVNLEILDEDPAAAGLSGVDVVKATFDAGTGDAPDDYYILYLDQGSGHLEALRYVVTYAPFFAGKETSSSPEKLLVYSDDAPAGPLTLARTHTFYAFGDGKKGPKVTDATISEVQYGAPFEEGKLAMPDGAVVSEM